MRLKTSILAALAVVCFAAPAMAQLTIAVTSTDDLNNILVGSQFTVDITLSTPLNEAQGLSLRIANINESTVDFVSATIPNFGGGATPMGGIFGTEVAPGVIINSLNNVLAGPVDNGTDVQLFNGVTPNMVGSNGPEVFTATFDAVAEGTVMLDIGALDAFGDAFVSSETGTTTPFTTTTVTVVPEPGAIAGSLAAVGSVLGVVTIRRRRD